MIKASYKYEFVCDVCGKKTETKKHVRNTKNNIDDYRYTNINTGPGYLKPDIKLPAMWAFSKQNNNIACSKECYMKANKEIYDRWILEEEQKYEQHILDQLKQ